MKDCPFCGGKDIRFGKHHEAQSPTQIVWSMCCYRCGATFPNRYKKELLVNAWNKRVFDIEAPVKELEGTHPVVLYFGSDEDREKFLAACKTAMPNAVVKAL